MKFKPSSRFSLPFGSGTPMILFITCIGKCYVPDANQGLLLKNTVWFTMKLYLGLLPLIGLYCYSSVSLLASLKRINEMVNIHNAIHKADVKLSLIGDTKAFCLNMT